MGVFADKVARRMPLSADEVAFLDSLEANPRRYARQQQVVRAGDAASDAFVLLTGWVMSYSRFPDGSYQVRRLHFPGDLIAMPSVPMRRHAEDAETLSDAVIAPFPKRRLAELFEYPRLAAVMYMFAQAERITSGDRLASVGRSPAKARVAFLLVDILERLRAADEAATDSFHMHLTREQVGQVTGMTGVHASRTWSELVACGLISNEGPLVTIRDEAALRALSGYRHWDGGFDLEWLGAVRSAKPAAGAAIGLESVRRPTARLCPDEAESSPRT
ncbi:MAG TPA: Crp/Fnr family transcriptional regulator [Allosphingosinicella sp.]|nr:Crp/Fnr family transcriptional regulator [Allosphingosinicella sp.]